jgi:hypothetical protein
VGLTNDPDFDRLPSDREIKEAETGIQYNN